MPTDGPLRVKVQLVCGMGTAMGPGKADILEAIDSVGSISAAGRELGMSYRRTWLLVDMMNRSWAEPLIDTLPGGARTGAKLTDCGRRVLAAYRGLESTLMRASRCAEMQTLSGLLRDEPLPSRHQTDGARDADP
jgi:molybdate transport system regulatory protein